MKIKFDLFILIALIRVKSNFFILIDYEKITSDLLFLQKNLNQ